MPKITSIKPQKDRKRVNIYLDGKFGFGLDLENFVRAGLRVEQILTDQEIKEVIDKGEFQINYNKLLNFTTLRPRSGKEVNDWYKKHKVPERMQSKMTEKLIKLELVDDEKFAVWWINQRQTFKPKGKKLLEIELTSKGISKEIIGKVLGESEIDESKSAKELLQKKSYKWDRLKGLEKKKKMSDFLARKGFSWDIIKEAIKTDEIDE